MKNRWLLSLTSTLLISCNVNISHDLPTDFITNRTDEIDLAYYAHHLNRNELVSTKEIDVSVKHFKTNEYQNYQINDLVFLDEMGPGCWTSTTEEDFYDDEISSFVEDCSLLSVGLVKGFYNSLDNDFMYPHYFSYKYY